ncbi:methyl-accepting chemotaxis protein [uncultured Roseobacter sp.]|uniref:methyl-accepting chemotaxis protein n=1 Tax=uncultured Roseobacter sp. TaxID=114847 RepID=UPI00262C7738|nr:methyl-accepting chemotaxis protein [uncultured Roseobacter sp.]
MKDFSQITVPDAATLDTLPYREAIDRVATLRAQVVRVALDISQLNRAGKSTSALVTELTALAGSVQLAVSVVGGNDVFPDLPEPLSHWIAAQCEPLKNERRVVTAAAEATGSLVRRIENDEEISDEALARYVSSGKGEVFTAVTTIINHLWEGIEEGRAAQLAVAAESARNLEASLDRLDRIGRYVRSMSINASVEASRAGDAGKGLTIIAHEFKTLAEEVQQLIMTARTDIRDIGVD